MSPFINKIRNSKITTLSTLTAGCIALSATASAQLTFNFSYADVDDGTNFGFNDMTAFGDGRTLGEVRQDTVEAVGSYIGSVINSNAVVDLRWNTSTNSSTNGNLGSFGQTFSTTFADFSNALSTGTGLILDGNVAGAILNDADVSGGADEGSGQINFGQNWNSDHLAATGPTEFDLFTVVLHEVSHALGFSSGINASGGSDLVFTDGTGNSVAAFTTYDTFLRAADGDLIVNSDGQFVGELSDLTSNDLNFQSADGALLDIFSPSTFDEGSSISHLDFTTDEVLNPSLAPGVEERVYGAGDLAVLSTLGFDIVPEPSSSLLFAVAATFGFTIRRRK